MDILDSYPKTPILDVVRIVSQQSDGTVLLVQEFDDENWKLPGGKTEPNETVLEAIRREIQEELGLVISRQDVKKVIKKPIPDSPNYRYIVSITINPDTIKKTAEVREFGYFSVSALPITKFQKHIKTAVEFVS